MTTYSINTFPGDGVTVTRNISFAGGFISRDHVKAYHITSEGTKSDAIFTWNSDSQIVEAFAAHVGSNLVVYRDTPKDKPLVDFSDGAFLTEANLDITTAQAIFVAQEIADQIAASIAVAVTADAAIVLPNAADRASKLLGFDATGKPIPVLSGQLETTLAMQALAAQAAADRAQTGLDVIATASDVMQTASDRSDTSNYRAAAGLAADAAKASSGTANTYMLAAQLAATATPGLFASTADGLAVTAVGRGFLTLSNIAGVAAIVYQNVAGTAVDVAHILSDAATSALRNAVTVVAAPTTDNPADDALIASWGDVLGYDQFQVRSKTLRHPHITSMEARIPQLQDGDGEFSAVDRRGQALFRATPLRLHHPQVTAMQEDVDALLSVSTPELKRNKAKALSEFMYCGWYGNSVSLNRGAGISTSPIPYAQMFDVGIDTHDTNDPSASLLVNAYGKAAASGDGEHASLSAFRMIAQLLLLEDGIDISSMGLGFGVSAMGDGSLDLLQLTQGTPAYTRLIRDVTRMKLLSAGKTFNVPFFVEALGGLDFGLDRDIYVARQGKIQRDVQATLATITGDQTGPMWLGHQYPAALGRGNTTPTFALAQLEMERLGTYSYLHTTYQVPYNAPDDQHPTNVGMQMIGADEGITMKRLLFDGHRRMGLRVTHTHWYSNVLSLTLSAVGQLKLDTLTRADFGNYGFDVFDAAGAAVAINSIKVLGRNTLQIVAAAPVYGMHYGWRKSQENPTISGGNVRDSQGDDPKFVFQAPRGTSAPVATPIHNWLPIMEVYR